MPASGDILRQAREARGISLAEAEEETKIRRRYLEAIETGHFEELPGDVYARGFVRIYARFLGVDPTAVVPPPPPNQGADRRNRPPFGAKVQAPPVQTVAAAAGTEEPRDRSATASGLRTAAVHPAHRPAPAIAAPRTGPVRRGRSLFTGVIIPVATVALLGYALYSYFSPGTPVGPAPTPKVSPAVASPPAPAPVATAPPVVAPPVVKPEPPPKPKVTKGAAQNDQQLVWVTQGPLKVNLDFRDRAWFQAWEDGQDRGWETPEAGQKREFAGEKEVSIRIGNTQGVHFTINGEAMGPLASDDARTVTIRVGEAPAVR